MNSAAYPSNPEDMVINTPLGDGYYLRVDELLRTLMYDRAGQKVYRCWHKQLYGRYAVQHLTNPNDVSIAKIDPR